MQAGYIVVMESIIVVSVEQDRNKKYLATCSDNLASLASFKSMVVDNECRVFVNLVTLTLPKEAFQKS